MLLALLLRVVRQLTRLDDAPQVINLGGDRANAGDTPLNILGTEIRAKRKHAVLQIVFVLRHVVPTAEAAHNQTTSKAKFRDSSELHRLDWFTLIGADQLLPRPHRHNLLLWRYSNLSVITVDEVPTNEQENNLVAD